jgi:hypothetical protein
MYEIPEGMSEKDFLLKMHIKHGSVYKWWLGQLEKGDEVAIRRRGLGEFISIEKVAKVTKTLVRLENGRAYNRSDKTYKNPGSSLEDDGPNVYYTITIPTEDVRKELAGKEKAA